MKPPKTVWPLRVRLNASLTAYDANAVKGARGTTKGRSTFGKLFVRLALDAGSTIDVAWSALDAGERVDIIAQAKLIKAKNFTAHEVAEILREARYERFNGGDLDRDAVEDMLTNDGFPR